MKRREFLRLAAMTPLFSVAPRVLADVGDFGSGWRTFELTYEVDLSAHQGPGRLWLPLPSDAGDYQRVLSVTWQGAPANASLNWETVYGAPIFFAEWNGAEDRRGITVTALVATRDRHMTPAGRAMRDPSNASLYLQPTKNMPINGIVAETARKIVRGKASPDEKARSIYEWIVDNTFREPKIRGCGMGDIKFMLESGNLGGKCADINALFVGLARATGLPAREMYGVRVTESAQFKSLGKAGDISKAQHCRAEYFSPRHGWVPVDPADVRKAVLEADLPLTDPQIVELRKRLFGYWEMNWVGFNTARDFHLSPKAGAPLPYLMYPYAEFGSTALDGRDPSDFKFRLSSREVGKRA
ncbi:MAG: transglutaminase family protein [Deltaproteobacteria bacterium]|nr:transglutaminase family protein [Deltaproteobacteria bacterium]